MVGGFWKWKWECRLFENLERAVILYQRDLEDGPPSSRRTWQRLSLTIATLGASGCAALQEVVHPHQNIIRRSCCQRDKKASAGRSPASLLGAMLLQLEAADPPTPVDPHMLLLPESKAILGLSKLLVTTE